jgi:hypothetical protein
VGWGAGGRTEASLSLRPVCFDTRGPTASISSRGTPSGSASSSAKGSPSSSSTHASSSKHSSNPSSMSSVR